MELVLIETLWNVKSKDVIDFAIGTSINRNIVECKVLQPAPGLFLLFRINRNIVECKDTGDGKDHHLDGVLIETLWNVKLNKYSIYISAFLY